jgi:hypothetical protein
MGHRNLPMAQAAKSAPAPSAPYPLITQRSTFSTGCNPRPASHRPRVIRAFDNCRRWESSCQDLSSLLIRTPSMLRPLFPFTIPRLFHFPTIFLRSTRNLRIRPRGVPRDEDIVYVSSFLVDYHPDAPRTRLLPSQLLKVPIPI